MQTIVLYHNSDKDGVCSAAVVACAENWDVEFRGMAYGDELDIADLRHRRSYIVDWSAPSRLMQQVFEEKLECIWIDHHATAIADSEHYGYSEMPGLRQDGTAACELAWAYLWSRNLVSLDIPWAVRALGAWDVWKWKTFPNAHAFQMGLRLTKSDYFDLEETRQLWTTLLQDVGGDGDVVQGLITKGKVVIEYQEAEMKHIIAAGRIITFTPPHMDPIQVLAVNSVGNSLLLEFARRYKPDLYTLDKVQAVLTFIWVKDRWKISLYSDRPDVHCGSIARAMGGGGHRGAAGWVNWDKTLPY
jgi:oligoribonuclease NrnB/cAMP/cGMP phosphodiesterase (DHH superfamily)